VFEAEFHAVDAFFEDEKSAAVINILNGALLDTCGVYLERYQNNNSLVELRKKYDFYIEIEAKEILKESLKQAMKEKFRETSNDN
jgi:hypothetical protein